MFAINPQMILDYLEQKDRWLTVGDIAKKFDISEESADEILFELFSRGDVSRGTMELEAQPWNGRPVITTFYHYGKTLPVSSITFGTKTN